MLNISELTVNLSAFFISGMVALAIFIIFWKNFWNDAKENSTERFGNCKNPKCVRCKLYSETIVSAKTKLKQLQKLHPNCDTQRIATSLNSVTVIHGIGSESLSHLKFPDQGKLHISGKQKPQVFRLAELNSDPWIEEGCFNEDVQVLESNIDKIYEEFKLTFCNKEAQWLLNDTPNGRWRVCHLINQGCVIEKNAMLCPFTFNLVSGLPSIMKNNVFGNVAFSVIETNTVITEHYGPTNVRSRCHLGLITPPYCKLTVNSESREWNYGKCLIFDDSFLHSVQYRSPLTENNTCTGTAEIRAVLLVDLWHPEVTLSEREAIDFIFAPKRG